MRRRGSESQKNVTSIACTVTKADSTFHSPLCRYPVNASFARLTYHKSHTYVWSFTGNSGRRFFLYFRDYGAAPRDSSTGRSVLPLQSTSTLNRYSHQTSLGWPKAPRSEVKSKGEGEGGRIENQERSSKGHEGLFN